MPKTREDFLAAVKNILDEAEKESSQLAEEEGFYEDVLELVASECEDRLSDLDGEFTEEDDDNLVETEDDEPEDKEDGKYPGLSY